MNPVPQLSGERLRDLIDGNHILYHQRIVDAFGHISVRHDADPTKYVMARHMAPGLVTVDDLLTYDLDSIPVEPTEHRLYGERFIHGEIYKARPDVVSVVHCHAPALIPFGATKSSLRPIYHMSAFLPETTPVFEIRAAAGMTNMLIRTPQLGAALARSLGDVKVVLMRGHGATMVGSSVREAVYNAIYATQNAAIQLEALRLGEVTFLAREEAELYSQYLPEVLHRPWNMWVREVEQARAHES